MSAPWKPRFATAASALQVVAACSLFTPAKGQGEEDDFGCAIGGSGSVNWFVFMVLGAVLIAYEAYDAQPSYQTLPAIFSTRC